MFCTNCGNNLDAGDNFCGKCGKTIHHQPAYKPDPVEQRVTEPVYKEPVVEREPYVPPVAPITRKSSEIKQQKKREKLTAELKALLEESAGREVTESELNESEMWLRGYADVMYKIGIEGLKREEKLKQNPKGFYLEGKGYSCGICGCSISDGQALYDKYGIKCPTCQDAINKEIIPAAAARDKDSWYSVWDLEHSFFINRKGLRRFVKEGLLKPRDIPGSSPGRPHYRLFFIEDNKDVLPPKELTKWPLVKFQKDGQDWYHSEPWLYYADAEKVLKGYKILDYMKTMKEDEIQQTSPDLSFQLNRGSSLILKPNAIDKDQPKPDEDSNSTK